MRSGLGGGTLHLTWRRSGTVGHIAACSVPCMGVICSCASLLMPLFLLLLLGLRSLLPLCLLLLLGLRSLLTAPEPVACPYACRRPAGGACCLGVLLSCRVSVGLHRHLQDSLHCGLPGRALASLFLCLFVAAVCAGPARWLRVPCAIFSFPLLCKRPAA